MHQHASGTNRIAYFDNARFLLVLLVIIGHFWGSEFRYWTMCPPSFRNVIYSFHMPMLALVSGYFCRAGSLFQFKKNINQLVIPYLIFQLFYIVWTHIIRGKIGSISLEISPPFHGLWYLWSLFVWRWVTPTFTQLKHPIWVALAVCLIVGYVPEVTAEYNLSRTICLYPFFLCGYYLTHHHLEFLKTTKIKVMSVGVLISGIVVSYTWFPGFSEWIYLSAPYSKLGHPEITAAFYRLVVIGVAFLSGFAFLSLVPSRKTWFTDFGRYTIYPYLLHMPLLWINYPFPDFQWLAFLKVLFGDGLNIAYITGVSLFLITVFSLRPVRAVFKPVVEPRWFKE